MHESMNLAALYRLPLVLDLRKQSVREPLCTGASERVADQPISRGRVSFDHREKAVDGNDVEAVYEAARNARWSGRAAVRGPR